MKQACNTDKNDTAFNPLCDFVFDGVVYCRDLGMWSLYYGKTGCPCRM